MVEFCLSETIAIDALEVVFGLNPVAVPFDCEATTTLAACNESLFGYVCDLSSSEQVTDDSGRVFLPVTLQATDDAGNMGFANAQVEMDLTPPSVVSAESNLAVYRRGQLPR